MSSKTRKIKPVNISKLSPRTIKLLNANKQDVILNPDELKKAIKDKKYLSTLLPDIKTGNKTKKFNLSREEQKTLSTLKTQKEIEDEQDKETEYYTALTEKRLYSASTSRDTLRKKLKRIFTKKSSEDKLQKHVNSKGGRKTYKRKRNKRKTI